MQQATHTRGASFDPADYTVEGIFDGHDEVGGWVYLTDQNMNATQGMSRNGTVDATDEFEAEVADVERTCAHCGRRYGFVFEAYVRHTPTGALLFMGSGCVDDASLDNAMQYAVKRSAYAQAAAARRAEVAAKRAAWDAANPEQAAALDAYIADVEAGGDEDEFLTSLAKARDNYGALTEGQTPWPTKALAKRAEWAAKRAAQAAALVNAPELAEGRYEVTGRVVSVKFVDNDFGGTVKMLVELADGNRVYGTVPSALFDNEELPEAQVAFTAKVERSTDDEHFGFFSRPTKARRVNS